MTLPQTPITVFGDGAGGWPGRPDKFAEWYCGPASRFVWAVRHAAQGAPPDEVETLVRRAEVHNPLIDALGARAGDRHLAGRHRGVCLVLKAVLGLTEEDARGEAFREAADVFESTWAGPVPTVADDPRTRPEDEITARYGDHLPLGRPGGWVVYDLLWHWQNTDPSKPAPAAPDVRASESTPFLAVTSGSGRVYRLVVELLDGPPGLVTPDWWPMGLLPFPQLPAGAKTRDERDRDADFAEAANRLLTATVKFLGDGKRLRLRWRVEPFRRDHSPGGNPICGRSGEAAVACVGAAVFEALAYPGEPILNPSAAITAMVDGDDPDVGKRTLSPVHAPTIPDKFQAAAEVGLVEVLVADGQKPDQLPTYPVLRPAGDASAVPVGSRELTSARVGSVADALLELCTTNKCIRAYQKHVRDEFDKLWVQEETPREENS
jgi:hypothetical protein